MFELVLVLVFMSPLGASNSMEFTYPEHFEAYNLCTDHQESEAKRLLGHGIVIDGEIRTPKMIHGGCREVK